MRFIKSIFKGLFSKVLFNSLPWVFLLLGAGFFALGTFVVFANPKWSEFFAGLGKTIIAGGILSLLLKSMQFMGIIKEELSKIVSDPDYLENRNDLAEYWGRVTKVLFENKFPDINSDITQDIKETYLPTRLIHYYENCSEIIDIELIDPVNEIVKVIHKSSFIIIPNNASKGFNHPYTNRIKIGPHCTPTFDVDYVKINDKQIDHKDLTKQEIIDENLTSSFTLESKGEPTYLIEYQVTKTYSIKDDYVIGFKNNHIHHNFRVQVFLNKVKVDFYEIGTLSKFKTILENEYYLEMQFTGLLYKGQGFLIFLKK